MFIVTGAAGFIGSAFVWELNNRGLTDVICVDDYGNDNRWKNLLKREFTDFVAKDELFDFLEKRSGAGQVKAIFHMGACSSTSESNMDFLLENNYRYTQKLFQWCTRERIPFIYASSAATYGNGNAGYDDSLNPLKLSPLNPYGYSKALFDRWALHQVEVPPQWIGLRFFNVFGPHEYHKGDMSSVAFKAFEQIKTTKSLKLFKSHNPEYKDGHQMRDFVYIKDATRWMWQLYEGNKASGIYNIGFGKARTWLDLAQSVFDAMEQPKKIQWIETPENIRSQYQYFTEAKLDKLLKTGLTGPEWPLERAVQDYVRNYLLQEDPYL